MTTPNRPPRLLDQVRDALRLKHYARSTEQTYIHWIRHFILLHNKRHPKDIGASELRDFLTHLAVVRQVSASTQNQALSAMLFLYRNVLDLPLGTIDAAHAKPSRHIPTVLTRTEVQQVLNQMDGLLQLMARLLYGSGIRLMECIRLRVKDLDFE